ncbi:hypothetical protein KPL70_012421 [Citrus sinensis]|uniref:COI1 F-box domain-containing protein n=1 Tax=Citrus clementina TaxID=85681 RepID=V4TCX3_CITCL|nr:hypothetical protein CICLE_v10003718mg [Citrus x clementina]KAH9707007.1 hypothetical protein KPL70_012421 [Citrus sinensis]GAY43344.1 hypothetical protein CUMW_073770 [Citrus unshiu]
MLTLGDDELSLIFHWINDSNNRNSFSLVCKRWLRVRVKPVYFDDVGDDGICAIVNGCSKLCKVSLRRRRKSTGNVGFISIVNKLAQGLTKLDLGRCSLISDQALDVIGTVRTIWVLKLDCCSLITKLFLNRFLRSLAFKSNGYMR